MTTLREFPKGLCNIKQDIKFWNIPRVHFLQSEWEEPKLKSDRISWQYLVWRGTYASVCILAFIVSFLTGTTQKHFFGLVYQTPMARCRPVRSRYEEFIPLSFSYKKFLVGKKHMLGVGDLGSDGACCVASSIRRYRSLAHYICSNLDSAGIVQDNTPARNQCMFFSSRYFRDRDPRPCYPIRVFNVLWTDLRHI
ncbi:unnamed protein product [Allacma fusca]|uniref:Uncharacterized protein n=1 Tax=Allacma fusca TaxID=39272 RepID=A0A8J2KYQ7_9HEXA|nr:unnamed protein product [Allacma fusca]